MSRSDIDACSFDILGFCGLPNALHREDLNLKAAAAGGYTHAVVVLNQNAVRMITLIYRFFAQTQQIAHLTLDVLADLTIGGFGHELSEMGRLITAGAI